MNPVETAAGFAAEIRRRAPQIEQDRRIPGDLAHRMAGAGLFRLLVPELYGGLQVEPLAFFETLKETARADGAVGWCQMIGVTTGMMAASLPDQWSRTIYGANPDTITCGVTAPLGTAVAEGDGLKVSGRWPFGSGCQISDWICGGCQLMEDGEPRKNRFGAPEIALVFFPAEEVTIHDTWHTSGLCGTGSHDIEVKDVVVPAGRWVTMGKRARVDAPLYRFPTLGLLALGVSAVALGIAEHAIDAFTTLARDKIPTGSARPLSARAGAQRDLARAMAAVQSAVALTREAIGSAWDEAEREGSLDLETKARLRLTAANNAWSAAEAVDLLYHAAGGSSIYADNALQQCFRDVHVATQHLMVAQPIYEVVGKVALGVDPKTLL